ncbi:NUDIX domain protein [Vibrio phage 2.275.O._10N.286.54.E11]|nr:NUDIX domain protein [Vibrio phage 2.275.O._10N.286.54.E11]
MISCGILFIRNGQILIGHATGQQHWDIPKGKMEAGEGFMDTAIRETKEEIGFNVDPTDIEFLAEVPYRKGKRLALFLYTGLKFPKAEECICTSTYTSRNGQEKPELDAFMYVPYAELSKYVTARMLQSILTVIENTRHESENI